MGKQEDCPGGLSRRQFLYGSAATGGAIVSGATVRHIAGSTPGFPDEVRSFTSDIYAGASTLDIGFPEAVDLQFFRRFDGRDEMEIYLTAYEYPSADVIDRSTIDVHFSNGLGNTVSVANASLGTAVEAFDVTGDVVEADDYEDVWRSDGRLYNMIDGVEGTGEAADLSANIVPDMDSLADTASTVAFGVQVKDDSGTTLIRQSQPMNPVTGEVSDPIAAETASEQYPSLGGQGDSGKFYRTDGGGRYVVWYNWTHDNKQYGVVVPVYKLSYASAKEIQPRYTTTAFERAHTNPYGRRLAEAMFEFATAEGRGEKYAFDLARTLAQKWPYERDDKMYGNIQHSAFTTETLVDGAGDCEGKTALMTSMLSQPPFEYDLGMVFPPEHVAPVVKRDDLPMEVDDDADIVTIAGEEFVYVESTSVNPAGEASFNTDELIGKYYDGRWYDVDAKGVSENVFTYFRELFDLR